MFSKDVFRWNAVDVMGCDRLLHRGLVVNKSKAGLSVDFGIPNKESTLIPYDRAFRDSQQRFMKREPLEENVELLYQLSPDQPWKWFPAQLLSTNKDSFLLVDMQTEGARVRAVFREDRVRRPSHSRENVRRNDFIKDEVPVPAGFLYTTDFRARWKERFPKTHPVGIVRDCFVYIQSRNVQEIPLKISIAMLNTPETELAALPHGIKRPLDDFLADEALDTSERSSLITKLPLEILAELFNNMEILDRTTLCRVCARFAAGVSSRACNVAIVYPRSRRMSDFVFASELYTILSKRIPYVIFNKDHHLVDDDIKLLQQMVNATGIKIPHFLLVDVAVNVKVLVDVDGANFALSPTFRSFCDRLVLKNVAVDEALGEYGRYECYDHVDVRIGSCTVRTDDETDFRHIFEENTKTPNEGALCRLGQWIQTLNWESRRSGQQEVVTMLKQWQYDDPRFGSHCTWEDVKRANLEKNLDTLRKTTLSALLSKRDNFEEQRRNDPNTTSDEGEDFDMGDNSSTDSD